MRKFLSTFPALVLVIALAVPAMAAETGCKLKEADVSLVVPDKYDALTQDLKTNDPLFHKNKLDGRKWQQWAEENDIYLNALSSDGKSTFLFDVVVLEDDEDFFGCDYDYVYNTAESVAERYEEGGMEILDYEVYPQSHAPFVHIDYNNPEKKTSTMYFFTVRGDQMLRFFFETKGSVTAAQEKTVKTFINSINLGMFEDVDSGVYFEVDSQWLHNSEAEKETTKAAFLCSENQGKFATILYGNTNLWEAAGGEDSGLDPWEINIEAFSIDDISDMTGAAVKDIKEAEINDVTYYMFEGKVQEGNVTLTCTNLVTIQNGFLHTFMNFEQKPGSNMGNFEAMMDTVAFPEE